MRFFIANGRPLGLSGYVVVEGPYKTKSAARDTRDYLESLVGSGDENEVVPATRATSGDPADTCKEAST